MQQDNASRARRRNDIAERRRALVLLLRAGHTQAEAAVQLGVSEGTISADLALLRAQSQQATATDMTALINEECAALDADEAALRAQLYDGKGDLRLFALDRIAVIRDQRARWRGFEQAPKGGGLADLDGALALLGLL